MVHVHVATAFKNTVRHSFHDTNMLVMTLNNRELMVIETSYRRYVQNMLTIYILNVQTNVFNKECQH